MDWVINAWQEVLTDHIRKSFKAAGITNALDGSENYLLNKAIKDSDEVKNHIQSLIEAYVDHE